MEYVHACFRPQQIRGGQDLGRETVPACSLPFFAPRTWMPDGMQPNVFVLLLRCSSRCLAEGTDGRRRDRPGRVACPDSLGGEGHRGERNRFECSPRRGMPPPGPDPFPPHLGPLRSFIVVDSVVADWNGAPTILKNDRDSTGSREAREGTLNLRGTDAALDIIVCGAGRAASSRLLDRGCSVGDLPHLPRSPRMSSLGDASRRDLLICSVCVWSTRAASGNTAQLPPGSGPASAPVPPQGGSVRLGRWWRR
mmetsp:Transcript_29224/g.86537  ORF Transcript_29224/g.86537 Transcript_29224/m.86537 type:complete len:252 (+) Transcript_29224:310-1065(+)